MKKLDLINRLIEIYIRQRQTASDNEQKQINNYLTKLYNEKTNILKRQHQTKTNFVC